MHAKVFSLLLQVAQGLGMSDSSKREQMVAAGMTPLTELVAKIQPTKPCRNYKNGRAN